MELSWVRVVPLFIIHFRFGFSCFFSVKETIQRARGTPILYGQPHIMVSSSSPWSPRSSHILWTPTYPYISSISWVVHQLHRFQILHGAPLSRALWHWRRRATCALTAGSASWIAKIELIFCCVNEWTDVTQIKKMVNRTLQFLLRSHGNEWKNPSVQNRF